MFPAHSNLTTKTLMSNLAILSGLYRGRVISSNIKEKVRPTSSKLRKSLFDILGDLSGSCVLDLFAGTGSVGFEAASRGASSVMFFEKNRRLSNSILKNTFLFDKTLMSVKHEDVYVFLEKNNSQFDVIFADPPYSSVDLKKLVELAHNNLKPEGRLIIESSVRQNWNPENGKIRNYGDTQLTFFKNE